MANGRIVASPRAKKLATQMGVDLSTVRGSGPHGRIQAEDVQQAGGQPISVPRVAEGAAPALSSSAVPAAGQTVVDQVRRQSANPLDPRVQEQVANIQQQVAGKRSELEEQKRNLLQQQAQVRELEMDQIVEQGQLESSCEIKLGDNLVQKMQVAIVVKDGVIQSIEEA